MGCSFSCTSSSSSSTILKTIRVVHLNGYVEDFEHPVTAAEVAGKPPRHIVCTPAQLVSCGGTKPLQPSAQLERGRVYFLLPYSTINQSDLASPVDLASIARKLSRIAKASRSRSERTRKGIIYRFLRPVTGGGVLQNKLSPANSMSGSQSPTTSPMRVEAQSDPPLRLSTKVRSWKPILDTIRERSFNRRSESDLQESHLEGSFRKG